jgi:S1-C subfamily serine protease
MKVIAYAIVVAGLSTAVLAQPSGPARKSPDPASYDPGLDVETILAEMKAFEAAKLGLVLVPTPRDDLLVIGIRSASPAARAGLRRGDFIVTINGKDISSLDKLKAAVDADPPRESATLQVWRGGEESELEILLSTTDRVAEPESRPWAGIQCDEVPGKGLVINAVYAGGPAAKAGLQVGDVVVSADGMKINSSIDAEKYLRGLQPFAEAKVVVFRNGEQRNLNVKMASLRETPEGLMVETSATDVEPATASLPHSAAPPSEMLKPERWEAEQHQRLEQLLQEIRADLRELKTKLENPKKDG